MKCRLNVSVILIAGASLALAACSSDNGTPSGGPDASSGGESGSGGSSTGGKSSTGGATSSGGTKSTGGTVGSGGTTAGTGGASGGTGTGGKKSGPDGGTPDGGDASTPDGGGDAGNPQLIARGSYLVNSVALCTGCHTDRSKPTDKLAGNATFSTGLPAPNLTSDATGLGSWSNEQIKNAFRNGIDSDGNPLSPVMPYQLFHNMNDADADAIVAYLRSLPHVSNAVGERTVVVTAAATPFSLNAFPPASGADGGAELAEAKDGFYLLSSIAPCVRCHSPQVNKVLDLGLTKTFTGGPANPTATATTPAGLYAPNITPDATGIAGWTVDDVVKVLKMSLPKVGTKICGMASFAGLTDADAHAIGVYLTNLPPIANTTADLSMEPTCP